MGHPRAVALILIFASMIGIANLAVNPVLSQNLSTPTSITLGSSVTTGYNRTTTIVQTYNTSSSFTQIIVAFVTSTTFYTYVQITFTSSTSTLAYPAPPVRPKPNYGNPLQTNYFLTFALSPLMKFGMSLSFLAAMLMTVFGLIRRKTLNVEG